MSRIADRVKENAIVAGTGNISLVGASDGFRTFAAGFGAYDDFYYVVELVGGTEFEVGIGTFVDASKNAIVRGTVLASSNAGALVNFSAGSKVIYCAMPAKEIEAQHEVVTGDAIAGVRSGGLITLDTTSGFVSLQPAPQATPAAGVRPVKEGFNAMFHNRGAGLVKLHRHFADSVTSVNGARAVDIPAGAFGFVTATDEGWNVVNKDDTAFVTTSTEYSAWDNTRFATKIAANGMNLNLSPTRFITYNNTSKLLQVRSLVDGSVLGSLTLDTYVTANYRTNIAILSADTVAFLSATGATIHVRPYTINVDGSITAGSPVQLNVTALLPGFEDMADFNLIAAGPNKVFCLVQDANYERPIYFGIDITDGVATQISSYVDPDDDTGIGYDVVNGTLSTCKLDGVSKLFVHGSRFYSTPTKTISIIDVNNVGVEVWAGTREGNPYDLDEYVTSSFKLHKVGSTIYGFWASSRAVMPGTYVMTGTVVDDVFTGFDTETRISATQFIRLQFFEKNGALFTLQESASNLSKLTLNLTTLASSVTDSITMEGAYAATDVSPSEIIVADATGTYTGIYETKF